MVDETKHFLGQEKTKIKDDFVFLDCLYVFLVSMLPIVELRGGMPIGIGLGIPFWLCLIVCVVGNMIPVPFLIMFSKSMFAWFARQKDVKTESRSFFVKLWYKSVNFIGKIFFKVNKRADEKAKTIGTYQLLGLYLFVAIPLPGTGAWTGALIAAILRLRLFKATAAILAGVVTSGLVMGIISQGVFGLL